MKCFSVLEKRADNLLKVVEKCLEKQITEGKELGEGRDYNQEQNKCYELLARPFKKEVIQKIKTRDEFSILIDSSKDSGNIKETLDFCNIS